MPNKSDTTEVEDQSRKSQKDTLLIEEVEPVEMKDQEKEEETLETWKMNYKEKNLKSQKKLPLPQSDKLLKLPKNNKSQKNPKN